MSCTYSTDQRVNIEIDVSIMIKNSVQCVHISAMCDIKIDAFMCMKCIFAFVKKNYGWHIRFQLLLI